MTATDDPRIAEIWDALRQVPDPEIGLDIVTLGLVYDIAVDGDVAHITHTLTSRGCPMGPIINQGIHDALRDVPGIAGVECHVVWDPSWHPGMIAPGALP